ncbi:leukocyte elastase inhibitor-like [Lingula anatina]|uniref:Leukocyte elastase inhibitor-like n=1 Tax=Lingula anatina TaxID=7574 RepID=A0A1S3K7B5_LINAN|nr:leukocyte elastase inhibitor-like [Lingula anatina]|eukprot:XP_013418151.1 leukocyte elastase inhibitor-like [Lingula anatina]
MKAFLFIVATPILLCLHGTEGQTVVPDDVLTLSTANFDFALQLYNKLKAGGDGKNIFFSPVSISTAFAMLHLGAKGNSRSQLEQVLKLDALSGNNVHKAFKDLHALLNSPATNVTLRSANRLYASNKYESFKDQFFTDASEFFGASVERKDFVGKAEASRQEINGWVEKQTEEKIKDLIPAGGITPATIMVLVNAIYFKGLWQDPFNASYTTEMPFRTGAGRSTNIKMMMIPGKTFPYAESAALKSKAIEIPYKGTVSMVVVVPDDVDGLAALEAKMDVTAANVLLDSLGRTDVNKFYFPQFELKESQYQLKSFLTSMGMTDIFGPNADLSGIGGNPGELQVDEAIHKAFIKVDEQGTEAAAATAITVRLTALTPQIDEFKVDRPFLFFIREKMSGSILFMGRVANPPPVGQPRSNAIRDGTETDDNSSAAILVPSWTLLLVIMWRML